MEIVATIGGQVALGFAQKARDADYRAAGLRLQKTAVEALLETAPKLADTWRPTLELMAAGWVQEVPPLREEAQAEAQAGALQPVVQAPAHRCRAPHRQGR